MNIAFDAKRIYQNRTGLGNYSRTLVNSLCEFFPEYYYFLFAPKITPLYPSEAQKNKITITPQGFPSKYLTALWRSQWIKKDLLKNYINIYHGLSHEIPFGIQKTKIKSVVTIHDLIFERYPSQYKKIDVHIYRYKFLNACKNADKIIAISEQTKKDIVDFYRIDAEKISTCYQSCNPLFYHQVSIEEKAKIKSKYNLPDQYFLFVGSVIERKNLLNICKAMTFINKTDLIPLVVIGEGKAYLQTVKKFLAEHQLEQQVIFLSEKSKTLNQPNYLSIKDFPGIYQQATAMIYPSIFEGFGIPILEALASQIPVITSNLSCMPEVGGDAAYYINPFSPEELAYAMKETMNNTQLVKDMKIKGIVQAEKFNTLSCATAVMNLYKTL